MSETIKIKRGTSVALSVVNPVLAAGEPCLETDTNKVKYGDGATAWNDLPYFSPSMTSVDGGSIERTTAPGEDFTPLALPGLVLWLDASDDSTVSLLDDRVLQWEDKSNNGSHAYQSLRESAPIYESKINGRGVLTFGDSVMVGSTDVSDFTLFIVFKKNSSRPLGFVMSADGSSSTAVAPCATLNGTLFGPYASGSVSAAQGVGNEPVVYTLTRDSGSLMTELNNAIQQQTTDDLNKRILYYALGGVRSDLSYGLFDGDIAEVAMYDLVLSSSEKLQVFNYLYAKWVEEPTPPEGVLFLDLLAFWPMDELEFTRFDISGNGKNLSLNLDIAYDGNVYPTEGLVGNAALFPANENTYLQCPASTLEVPTGSMSVSFWFNAASVSGDVPLFGNRGGVDGGQFSVAVDDGVVKMYLKTSSGVQDSAVSPQVLASSWNHVCGVYDSVEQSLVLYLNGVASEPVSVAGSIEPTTNRIEVCAGNQGLIKVPGDTAVDLLGIWSRTLTSGEIDYLYNDGIGTDDLSGYIA